MSVTNYISLDGLLVGEMAGGVMRNYGTDALGSVVETVLNGVEENTYQYKPYGGLLAKTGVASDPSFLWNGGSGYIATGLHSAEFSIRRRTYSSSVTNWTTVDPLLYVPGLASAVLGTVRGRFVLNSYSYVFASPLLRTDPSGLCPVSGNNPIFIPSPAPRCPQDTGRDQSSPCDRNGVSLCGKRKGEIGETDCNFTLGKPFIRLCDNQCTCSCTLTHEQSHVADISACCGKLGNEWIKRPQQYSHIEILGFWQAFEYQISAYTECQAYKAGFDCLLNMWEYEWDYLNKKCQTDLLNELSDTSSCSTYFCKTLGGNVKPPLSAWTQCGMPSSNGLGGGGGGNSSGGPAS